jgi:hypothetical protein
MSILVLWLSILHRFGLDLPVQLLTATRSDGLVVAIVAPGDWPYWKGFFFSTLGFGTLLFVVVRNLWPLEFMKLPWFDAEPEKLSHSKLRSVSGVLMVSVGLLAVSGSGFSGFPFAIHESFGIPINTAGAVIAIFVGLALLRQPSIKTNGD